MKRAAVSFTFFDDIKTVYGLIKGDEPLAILFSPSALSFPSQPESVVVSVIGGEKFYAEIINIDGNLAHFEKKAHILKDAGGGLSVDYKSEFTAAIVTDGNRSLYLSYCNQINSSSRNKLSAKLGEMLKREDSENVEIFAFLFDMNSKLDEILSILKPPFAVDGGFAIRCMSLSGVGFTFFSAGALDGVKTLFIRALLSDAGGRFYFGALCDIELIKENNDGSGLYSCKYLNLDEDIKDAIVRFLFSREREILKEARF